MSDEHMRPFIGLNSIFMTLPEVDEHGTPKDKMPYCPRCSDDELSMLGMYAFCNRCNLKIYPVRKFECEHKYIENMGKPNQRFMCDLVPIANNGVSLEDIVDILEDVRTKSEKHWHGAYTALSIDQGKAIIAKLQPTAPRGAGEERS